MHEQTPLMLSPIHVLDEKVAIIPSSSGKSLTTTGKKLPVDTHQQQR